MSSRFPSASDGRRPRPVMGRAIVVAILSVAAAVALPPSREAGSQGPGDPAVDGRRLLAQRREEARRMHNPWQLQDHLYHSLRELSTLRSRMRLQRLEEAAASPQEDARRRTAEASARLREEAAAAPVPPRIREQMAREAFRQRLVEEPLTPQGRIQLFLRRLVESDPDMQRASLPERRERAAEDLLRLRDAQHPELASAPLLTAEENGGHYISGAVRYDTGDTTDFIEGHGIVQLFDEWGYPIEYEDSWIGEGYGEYSLWADEPGSYYVVVVSDGFSVMYWDGEAGSERGTDAVPVVVDTSEVEDIDFLVPTGAVLSGTLSDLQGTPVGGYNGYFYFYEDTGDLDWYYEPVSYAYVEIDTAGNWQVRGIRPGRYYVQYQGYYYQPVWYGDTRLWNEASVAEFPDRTTVISDGDLTIYNGTDVAVRLFDSDGVTPLSDVKSYYYTAFMYAYQKPPADPPDGWFPESYFGYVYDTGDSYGWFYGLPAGDWQIEVYEINEVTSPVTWWEGDTFSLIPPSAAGPDRAASQQAAAVLTLPAGEGVWEDTLRVDMDRGGTLEGSLLLPDSTGFDGAYVYALNDEVYGLMYDLTEGGGLFTIPNLPGMGVDDASMWYLQTSAAGSPKFYYSDSGGTFDFASRRVVSIAPGDTVRLGEWRFPEGGMVVGTLTDSTTGLPVYDYVSLFDAAGSLVASRWSDYNDGTYRFDHVPPGQYQVGVLGANWYQPEMYENLPFGFPPMGDAFALTAGDSLVIDFELLPLPVIAVDVARDPETGFYFGEADLEIWDASTHRRLVDFYWDWDYSYYGSADTVRAWVRGIRAGDYKVRIAPWSYNYDYYDEVAASDGNAQGRSPPYPYYHADWAAQFYRFDPDPALDGAASWEGADAVTLGGAPDTAAVMLTVEHPASLRGRVKYGLPDSSRHVAGDSLGVFVVLFDAATGGFVGTAEFEQNTFAGGFEFDHLLPGEYKLATLGADNGVGGWWFDGAMGTAAYASAAAIPVESDSVEVVTHYLAPAGSGSSVTGGVYVFNQDDPSEYSFVMAYTSDGIPASLGFSGPTERQFLEQNDVYSWYDRPTREQHLPGEPAGSYRLGGLADGDYYLRTWSFDLIYEILLEYYYEYEVAPPAGTATSGGAQRDLGEPPPDPLLDFGRVFDMWYRQVAAQPLLEYAIWEPEIGFTSVPGGATPVTVSGGDVADPIDFFLRTLDPGDPNGDGVFDISDVITLVNGILRIGAFGLNQEMAADLNGDGVADIADVVAMVNTLLGGQAAAARAAPIEGDFHAALGNPESATGGPVIPLWTRLGGPVAGLQFEFRADPGVEVEASDLPAGFTMATRREGERLLVLLYSLQNQALPAQETRLLKFRGAVSGGAPPIEFVSARAASPAGEHVSLQTWEMGAGPLGLRHTFRLEQNWPNPFNPSTTIAFTLPESSPVRLQVRNVRGQLVRTLVDGPMTPGPHSVIWDGRDGAGRQVASGIYLYVLEAGPHRASRKMLLVK